jgi:hypothetical protein
MVGGDGVNSILRFQLKREGDGTKCCRKMKWRQQTHLDSIGSKCDIARRRSDVGQRRGGTGEEKGRRQHPLGRCESYWAKNKENSHY